MADGSSFYRDGALTLAFWRRIEKPDGDIGCWVWNGAHSTTGYGVLVSGARRHPIHRLLYELFVGPIPEGFEVDHLCRNPPCCNPTHLEPVTHRENMLRGKTIVAMYAARTRCKNGHLLAGRDLGKFALGKTGRRCLACHRERERERGAKARQARRDEAARAQGSGGLFERSAPDTAA